MGLHTVPHRREVLVQRDQELPLHARQGLPGARGGARVRLLQPVAELLHLGYRAQHRREGVPAALLGWVGRVGGCFTVCRAF